MMVKIKGMNDDIMAILLDYLYTSRVSITSDNAQHLLEASSLFQVRCVCVPRCREVNVNLHAGCPAAFCPSAMRTLVNFVIIWSFREVCTTLN